MEDRITKGLLEWSEKEGERVSAELVSDIRAWFRWKYKGELERADPIRQKEMQLAVIHLLLRRCESVGCRAEQMERIRRILMDIALEKLVA